VGAGHRHDGPPPPVGARELGPEVVEAIKAAMVDVVSNDPHATGCVFHKRMLKELGLDLHGLIAGKTGTAVSRTVIQGRGSVEVRNASFVGYAPADSPRFLAVCVLQRDDDARFYGGSYAAPPVARVLLAAMKIDELRRERQEPQVSATPGGSGWSANAPETTQAGR
jgi:cell division protein FtsI/penicillin-binding protein 2